MEFTLERNCCSASIKRLSHPSDASCLGRLCAKVRSLDQFLFLTIFIGNLSWDAEREDLTHLFSQYGDVSKCSLPLDRETGRKRGFAFVDLSNEADEQSAIDDLQNVEWMGRAISVRKAEPRR